MKTEVAAEQELGASARGSSDGRLAAGGRAGRRLALDQLAYGRDASAAAASRMTGDCDLARGVRAALDHFADRAVAEAAAVADDHRKRTPRYPCPPSGNTEPYRS